MPGTKKKAKGKGGGGGKKKKGAAEKEELVKLSKNLLKTYQQRCTATSSTASPRICREIRSCIENETALSKFLLDPAQPLAVRQPPPSSRSTRGPSATASSLAAAKPSIASSSASVKSPTAKDSAAPSTESKTPPPPVLLQPLVNSWVDVKYSHVRCLHVWSMELEDDAIVSLALFFESAIGPSLQVLELREAKLSSWAVSRLSKSLKRARLTVLNLDFNPLSCSALGTLCESLQKVATLTTLSLNFCQLQPSCGEPLGMLTATSQIRELSLIGNHLECDGFNEFFRPLVSIADLHISAASKPPEKSTISKAESIQSQLETPPITSLLAAPPPPQQAPPPATPIPPLPPLAKLYLQDNCIDIHGECTDMDGVFASVICMRTLKRYILSSPLLEEVNLEGNWIGDGGAREIMLGLQQRKEAGLPPLKTSLSARICPEIFTHITELNPKSGTKKKGKKAKKKKK